MIPGETQHPEMIQREKHCQKRSAHSSCWCCCHYIATVRLLQKQVLNCLHIGRVNKMCCDKGGRSYRLNFRYENCATKDKWGSTESRHGYYSSIQNRVLGQLWIQFDKFYGMSIDDLIRDDNPTVSICQLKQVVISLRNGVPLPTKVVITTP